MSRYHPASKLPEGSCLYFPVVDYIAEIVDKIITNDAPASIGPFSQGVVDSERVFVSGQGPVDPATGEIVDGDVREQTVRTMKNIEAILDAANCTFDDVVKTTVYVINMADYDAINEAYDEFVSEPYPARSAVQVASLPIDIDIEIEVVASRRTQS